MEIIIILILSILVLIIFSILFRVNKRSILIIKELGQDRELNEITNALPDNVQVCKELLCKLKNNNVKIKQGSENSKASIYVVATNTILIANIKDTFTRIQTIAHECIHSIQDKRLLWFNFIFSNMYLIYFATITILTILNKLPFTNIFAIVLVVISAILYIVRSYIETDAMIKSRYIAKEYMETKQDLISQENIEVVVKNYDLINEKGVKLYNFTLLFGYLSKIIIYCVVAII